MASVRRHLKLSPCQMELVPDGCKTDLPLARAEPISDTGSVSGITYLRRGKIELHSCWERGAYKTTEQTRRSMKKLCLEKDTLLTADLLCQLIPSSSDVSIPLVMSKGS